MVRSCFILLLNLAAPQDGEWSDPSSLPSFDEVRDHFEGSYRGLKSLYVAYDLSVSTPDEPTWDLQVQATHAIEGVKQWKRTVHFYRDLYAHDDHPEYDPILNWILMDQNRFTRLDETTRRAVVLPRRRQPMVGLEIGGFFQYMAYLEPEYAVDLEASGAPDRRAAQDRRLAPQEFYLPWALRQAGWSRVPKRDSWNGLRCIVLERLDPRGTEDRIWVDPRRSFALLKRELKAPFKQAKLTLEYGDPIAVSDKFWMPTQILARFPDHARLLKAWVLRVNWVPPGVFDRSFPPGTVVTDFQRNRRYVLPGGQDLLDFTVERIAYSLKQASGSRRMDRGSVGATAIRIIMTTIALVLVGVVFLMVRARTRKRFRVHGGATKQVASPGLPS